MEVEISIVCGGCVFEVTGISTGFFNSRSYTKLDVGAVRNIMDRLWSVNYCFRNRDAGWGQPKWDVSWVPVDKTYTREKFVTDLLQRAEKMLMPYSAPPTVPQSFSDLGGA
jgi:hypothetical protein